MISMVQNDSIIHKGRRKQLAIGGWDMVMKPVMTEEYNVKRLEVIYKVLFVHITCFSATFNIVE